MYQLGGLRALIADDSAYFRTILRSMLRGFGLRDVQEASDGAICLATIEQFRPHIVLLDWEMPAFDGAAVVNAIARQANNDRPAILMITSHTELSRIKSAMTMPIDGLLCKPFAPKILYERLFNALENYERSRTARAPAEDKADYILV